MKNTIFTLVFVVMTIVTSVYAQQQIFLIDFTITQDDKINIERFLITEGTPVSNDFNSKYSAKMFSRDKLLFFTDFIVDFTIDEQAELTLPNNTESVEERTLDQAYITLKFPADRIADKMVFYKNGIVLYTLNLEDYLKPATNYKNFLFVVVILIVLILMGVVYYFVRRKHSYESLRAKYSRYK